MPLVAEGFRKLALLWLLIRNGSLSEGSVLFWDEPETNLNPSMLPTVIEALLKLSDMGVQIFLATHSYAVLKELDLQRDAKENVQFIALKKTAGGDVTAVSTHDYGAIDPNLIADELLRIYDLEVDRALDREP